MLSLAGASREKPDCELVQHLNQILKIVGFKIMIVCRNIPAWRVQKEKYMRPVIPWHDIPIIETLFCTRKKRCQSASSVLSRTNKFNLGWPVVKIPNGSTCNVTSENALMHTCRL